VLVAINGTLIDDFVGLEGVIDDAVNQSVVIEVERSGVRVELDVTVGDLHAITPSAFVEYGGGTVNELSYQVARGYGVPVLSGLHVVEPGYTMSVASIGPGAVITAVDGKAVSTLEEFIEVVGSQPHGASISIRYHYLTDANRDRIAVISNDRQWFEMRHCKRPTVTGEWTCDVVDPPTSELAHDVVTTSIPRDDSSVVRKLLPSLVSVDFDVPYRTDGVYAEHFRGSGLIVDAEKGLVATDRDTVPVMMGDLTLTFGGSIRVPGEVVWIHPEHNITLIQFDPTMIGDTPIRSAQLLPWNPDVGEEIWQVGLNSDNVVVSRQTEVTEVYAIGLPIPGVPFFRELNLDVIDVRDVAGTIGGVLSDRHGRVRAVWASFVDHSFDTPRGVFQGLPVELLIEAIANVDRAYIRSLGIEFDTIGIAEARDRGLGADRVALLEEASKQRQVIEVVRVSGATPARELVKNGDLVLSIDGVSVDSARDIERQSRKEQVVLELFREGQAVHVTVPTTELSTKSTARVVGWGGAVLQTTPLAAVQQRGLGDGGVYIGAVERGSPAAQYGLRTTRRIIAINGHSVTNVDELLSLVKDIQDGDSVQVTTKCIHGRVRVTTLRVDLNYWPTFEVIESQQGWTRITL